MASLGPECSVLAYLDDIYILSNSDTTLSKVEDFFSQRPECSLHLNLAKSSITQLDSIKHSGMKILGSMVGPKSARHSFLQKKIADTKAKLDKLVDLPHQHALLLLRLAIQQDLRHLQRTLQSDDLDDLWHDLDMALWDKARSIRGAPPLLTQNKTTLCGVFP
jgi:Tfp pilus assembly protein PilN